MSERRLSRRQALSGQVGLGLAGAAALAAPNVARAQSSRALAVVAMDGALEYSALLTRLAERVALVSRGTLRLEAAGANAPVQAVQTVANGNADAALGRPDTLMPLDPAFGLFSSVPFGLDPREFEAWVQHGGGQRDWDDLARAQGIKPVLVGDFGSTFGGWFQKPFIARDDIANMRIATEGLGAVAVEAAGAIPVVLDGGGIGASVSFGLTRDMGLGLSQAFPFLVTPSLFHPQRAIALQFNASLWDSLSEEERMILTTCCEAETEAMMTERLDLEMRAFGDLVRGGTQSAPISDALYAELAGLAHDALSERFAASPIGASIWLNYQDFLSKVSGWSEVGEGLFTVKRAAALGM
ncbi:MAG: hypothetical protein AAFR93_04350 [Pseudomonadota bacterium]